MIKIRLHGLPEEVKKARLKLEEIFNVLNVSEAYDDRGSSSYVRLYIDVDVKDNDFSTPFQIIVKHKSDNSVKIINTDCIFLLANDIDKKGIVSAQVAKCSTKTCLLVLDNIENALDDFFDLLVSNAVTNNGKLN